ncbi:MAG: HAD hydrolase-like protein [Oscillospiraceae bacterium]
MNCKKPRSGVEIVSPWDKDKFNIRYALFDFDGTISLIREGWQDIMIPYFCEILKETGTSETDEEIKQTVRRFVTDLTGKQTIFQCIRLNEELEKRGGRQQEPIVFKNEYLRRLDLRIKERKEALFSGTLEPEAWLVPGSKQFLGLLQSHGIKCYLASGTDEEDVLYEAKLLGLENAFEGGIHGAHEAMTECSKELVIHSMLENEHIRPEELVSFGDGYVEVELVAKLGGLAIGAATEEAKREGVNEWKRSRLIAAGAYAIIPDFRDTEAIYELIK